MLKQFSELKDHHRYVLRLYRYTIRTTHFNVSSILYRKQITNKVREKINNNRNNKSSWSVRNLLEQLESLNRYIQSGEYKQAEKLLSESKKSDNLKQIKEAIVKITPKEQPPRQDPNLLRQSNILDKYIKIKRSQGKLPHQITKLMKRKLLLPAALDWHAKLKIARIEAQLEKGVPEVYLNYTRAGPSTIWFVRSPVNKKKAQSKKLSNLIETTRKENQDILDSLDVCKQNAEWALSEALWEETLLNGNILKFDDTENILKRVDKIVNSKELLSAGTVTENLKYKDGIPISVISWLSPISDTMNKLNNTVQKRARYFDRYKDNVILKDGHIDYYKKKTADMHLRRKARFQKMMEEDVPNRSIFDMNNNLYSILEKYKF
ncbi:Essential for respiratory growth and required for mitochondrial protein synthesis [Maudiozyma exigua]|uniref:Essential for respiratory growth and required for mitochondrial protein synthesis n=1 Tax=Maudiozyma exigua TaxID=34358 RepID=A0A9P7B9Y2_MAUEX|nr:Essential for respiratory growth and required for mitochondrial protein synthesis [Kazachstania exigua]